MCLQRRKIGESRGFDRLLREKSKLDVAVGRAELASKSSLGEIVNLAPLFETMTLS